MTSPSAIPPYYRVAVLREPVAKSWLLPFLIAGAVCIIAGGFLAAATAYATTQKTVWATAYIVLVGGAAQVGLGAAVTWLAPLAPHRLGWLAFVGWNIGNIGVLVGQLAGVLVLTYVGTAILMGSLVCVLLAVRGRTATARHIISADDQSVMAAGPGSQPAGYLPLSPAHPGALWLLRGLVTLLAVSMPVGIILAHVG